MDSAKSAIYLTIACAVIVGFFLFCMSAMANAPDFKAPVKPGTHYEIYLVLKYKGKIDDQKRIGGDFHNISECIGVAMDLMEDKPAPKLADGWEIVPECRLVTNSTEL